MTNSEATYLIALTRTHIPRTPQAIAAETGIPLPSLRRLRRQLAQQGYRIDRRDDGVLALRATPQHGILGCPIAPLPKDIHE